MLDVGLLEAYRYELATVKTGVRQVQVVHKELMVMYADVLKLLRMCVTKDASVLKTVLSERTAMKQCTRLLSITVKGNK